MQPRYLRFVQALALVSVGCGGTVIDDPTTADADRDAARDAASDGVGAESGDDGSVDDTTVHVDTSLPDTAPPSDASGNGTCTDFSTSIECTSVCNYEFGRWEDGGQTVPPGAWCGESADSAPVTACGKIACASPCWCQDQTQSVCNCTIAVGPLPPPDLPVS